MKGDYSYFFSVQVFGIVSVHFQNDKVQNYAVFM